MEGDDFVKCPLCDGLAKVRKSDVIALLAEKNLRERLEKNMSEFTPHAEGEQAVRKLQRLEFKKEVHNWNPTLPLWRRSPKE